MARKTIFAVGFDLPDIDGFETFPITSDQSLLDADIIVFRPTLAPFASSLDSHHGRRLLNQHSSCSVEEKIGHWTAQIKSALEATKTVIVFLPQKEEVFRYTGDKTFSGTGRSRVATNIVTPVSNYDFLPIRFDEVVPGQGRAMKLASNAEIITAYWQHASSISVYEVHFSAKEARPLILTKSGDKVVGAIVSGTGRIVYLPNIEWDKTAFVTEDGDTWTEAWTIAAKTFTCGLRDQILGIDAALRANAEGTPEPDWAKRDAFRLNIEAKIEREILSFGAEIEEIVNRREERRKCLRDHGSLRALLFEKGKPLEAAVRDALKLIGFNAGHFKEGDSEFDAVFDSAEGRFLGEVEGKDTKAINVEKYSQLERNINEDLSREDVTELAMGVLFGNAYRLMPPDQRGEFFTEKVLAAAKRTGCALVRTPDLFTVARYLKETADENFAEECRKAIARSAGEVVVFPSLATSEPEKISEA
jgi:hypothetical protein